jgi:hypothetical protein
VQQGHGPEALGPDHDNRRVRPKHKSHDRMVRERDDKSLEPILPPGGRIMMTMRQTEQNRVQSHAIFRAIDSELKYKQAQYSENVLFQPRREPIVLEIFQTGKAPHNINPQRIKFIIQVMKIIFPNEKNCIQQ